MGFGAPNLFGRYKKSISVTHKGGLDENIE